MSEEKSAKGSLKGKKEVTSLSRGSSQKSSQLRGSTAEQVARAKALLNGLMAAYIPGPGMDNARLLCSETLDLSLAAANLDGSKKSFRQAIQLSFHPEVRDPPETTEGGVSGKILLSDGLIISLRHNQQVAYFVNLRSPMNAHHYPTILVIGPDIDDSDEAELKSILTEQWEKAVDPTRRMELRLRFFYLHDQITEPEAVPARAGAAVTDGWMSIEWSDKSMTDLLNAIFVPAGAEKGGFDGRRGRMAAASMSPAGAAAAGGVAGVSSASTASGAATYAGEFHGRLIDAVKAAGNATQALVDVKKRNKEAMVRAQQELNEAYTALAEMLDQQKAAAGTRGQHQAPTSEQLFAALKRVTAATAALLVLANKGKQTQQMKKEILTVQLAELTAALEVSEALLSTTGNSETNALLDADTQQRLFEVAKMIAACLKALLADHPPESVPIEPIVLSFERTYAVHQTLLAAAKAASVVPGGTQPAPNTQTLLESLLAVRDAFVALGKCGNPPGSARTDTHEKDAKQLRRDTAEFIRERIETAVTSGNGVLTQRGVDNKLLTTVLARVQQAQTDAALYLQNYTPPQPSKEDPFQTAQVTAWQEELRQLAEKLDKKIKKGKGAAGAGDRPKPRAPTSADMTPTTPLPAPVVTPGSTASGPTGKPGSAGPSAAGLMANQAGGYLEGHAIASPEGRAAFKAAAERRRAAAAEEEARRRPAGDGDDGNNNGDN